MSLVRAFSGPRPPGKLVKLTAGDLRVGSTFFIDESVPDEGEQPTHEWVSLGSVLHRISNLQDTSQQLVTSRAKPSTQTLHDIWPRNLRLKLSYIGKVKENGDTYLVYRLKHVLRFVPESAQPPRWLYMDMRDIREPVLVADEPTPAFSKVGRQPIPVPLRSRILVDNPKQHKANLLVMPVALSQTAVDQAQLEAKVANAVDEFASTRASPEFRRWFEGASQEVRNEDGSPKVFFRGQTAGSGDLRARLVLDSFTDSPDVASIYSTARGNVQEGSNVIPVYIDIKNPLKIDAVYLTFYDVLSYLGYWDNTGISAEESTKILNYLTKRHVAAEAGMGFVTPKGLKAFQGMPSFKYQLKNEEDTDAASERDLEEEDLVDFDAMGGMLQYPLRTFQQAWQDAVAEEDRQLQERLSLLLAVDTFAFIETPAVKRALQHLGYDGVIHLDPFSAEGPAQQLMGKGMEDLVGVEEGESEYDWEELETDWMHWTVRPLDRSQVWPVLADQPMAPSKLAAAVRSVQLACRCEG